METRLTPQNKRTMSGALALWGMEKYRWDWIVYMSISWKVGSVQLLLKRKESIGLRWFQWRRGEAGWSQVFRLVPGPLFYNFQPGFSFSTLVCMFSFMPYNLPGKRKKTTFVSDSFSAWTLSWLNYHSKQLTLWLVEKTATLIYILWDHRWPLFTRRLQKD